MLKKTITITLLTLFTIQPVIVRAADYTAAQPKPTFALKNLMERDLRNRDTVRTILQVVGGIMLVGGLLTQEDNLGNGLKIGGGVILLSSLIFLIPSDIEQEGASTMAIPAANEKENTAALLIFKEAEKRRFQRIGGTLVNVFDNQKVEAQDVYNALYESDEERYARQIKVSVGETY